MEYNTSRSQGGDSGVLVDLVTTIEPTCNPYSLPNIIEYFQAFSLTGVCVLSVGGLAMVLILGLYLDTIRHILRSAPESAKSHSVYIVSVYPVVGLVSYCASVVPRAQLIAEAFTQGMFMTALYQLFCLVMAYGGGEAQLIKKVHPSQISLQVAPCCCWTCFSCLPTYVMNKKNLLVLRGLVLQLPIIQSLAYLALLVMWTEEQDLYQINYNYFQPVVVTSILLGIWGMIMTVKVTQQTLKDYNIQGKFIVLQLVLLLAKFQALIARSIAMSNIFPCRNPITPTVYTNLIYNSAMLWEMVLLSACARMLYIKPLPECYPTDKNSNLPKQICTLQEKITITENHTINENNTSSEVQY